MIVGSVGSIIYGEPRMTKDMDIVIELFPQSALIFSKMFPIEEYYCPPTEILAEEIINRGQFNLIHHKSCLKIDIMVRKNDEFSIQEFKRRVKIPFVEGVEVYVATPEDIIINKLFYYKQGKSEKHLSDIKGILANTHVDYTYINESIKIFSLEKEWDCILK